MPVPSLFDIAKSRLIRSIDGLWDVGDYPYSFLRPILLHVQNPEQLKAIEEASPQIAGEDAEIWRSFIKRDIPNWEEKYFEPKNPKSWHKVYRKLKKEADATINAQTEQLRAIYAASEAAKRSTSVIQEEIVDDPALRRRRFYNQPRPGGGRTLIDKVRRGAQQVAKTRQPILATPSHLLSIKATKVKIAPKGMIEDWKRAKTMPRDTGLVEAGGRAPISMEVREALSLKNSTSALRQPGYTPVSASNTLVAREARLLALTRRKAVPADHFPGSRGPGMDSKATDKPPPAQKVNKPEPPVPQPLLSPSFTSTTLSTKPSLKEGPKKHPPNAHQQDEVTRDPDQTYLMSTSLATSDNSSIIAVTSRPLLKRKREPNIFMPAKRR